MSQGYIRFKTPEQTTKAVEELTERKTSIKDKVPTLSLLADKEEMVRLALHVMSASQGVSCATRPDDLLY